MRHKGGPKGPKVEKPPAAAQLRKEAFLAALQYIYSIKDEETGKRQLCAIFMELPDQKDFPDYYELIKKPLSFNQMQDKAEKSTGSHAHVTGYRSWSYFKNAVNRVLKNALTYNEPGSMVALDAHRLQMLFAEYNETKVPPERKKKPSELIEKDPAQELADLEPKPGARMSRKHGVIAVLRHLESLEHPESGYKLTVAFTDLPDKEDFEDYYKEIKQPVCMRQMWERATASSYTRWATFENELLRLLANAKAYNQPGTSIHEDAKTLEQAYRDFVPTLPTDITARSEYEVNRVASSGLTKRKRASDTSPGTSPRGGGGADKATKDAMHTILKTIVETWSSEGMDDIDPPKRRDRSAMFHELPSREDDPDYFKAIERPIDLNTVRENIDGDAYDSLQSFGEDLQTLFGNAEQYNLPDAEIAQDAAFLWSKVVAELEAVGAAIGASSAASAAKPAKRGRKKEECSAFSPVAPGSSESDSSGSKKRRRSSGSGRGLKAEVQAESEALEEARSKPTARHLVGNARRRSSSTNARAHRLDILNTCNLKHTPAQVYYKPQHGRCQRSGSWATCRDLPTHRSRLPSCTRPQTGV